MKLLIEKIPDLQALYIRQLRVLLWAEEMIPIKMSFLVESSTDSRLSEMLRQQVEESAMHAEQLREILHRTGAEEIDPITCKVVYALFGEAEDMIQDAGHADVRDFALIAVAQRIKHYQIAFYGAVLEFARILNRALDAEALDKAIHEEYQADHALAEIAGRINPSVRRVA